jgi:hypothetical protein
LRLMMASTRPSSAPSFQVMPNGTYLFDRELS